MRFHKKDHKLKKRKTLSEDILVKASDLTNDNIHEVSTKNIDTTKDIDMKNESTPSNIPALTKQFNQIMFQKKTKKPKTFTLKL